MPDTDDGFFTRTDALGRARAALDEGDIVSGDAWMRLADKMTEYDRLPLEVARAAH